MRTASEVQVEIEATRTALFAADEAAGAPGATWDPASWDLGTILLEQLAALHDEYAHIPHPRLPSDRDGHTAPRGA